MFRAPLCPSSGAREYYTSGCCLWYFVLWFSGCRYGVELKVMCPVCGHITFSSTPYHTPYHTKTPNTTGSNHLYNTPELLMMCIVVPETCWASNKICNKNRLLHLVGILFPPTNMRFLSSCDSALRTNHTCNCSDKWHSPHYQLSCCSNCHRVLPVSGCRPELRSSCQGPLWISWLAVPAQTSTPLIPTPTELPVLMLYTGQRFYVLLTAVLCWCSSRNSAFGTSWTTLPPQQFQQAAGPVQLPLYKGVLRFKCHSIHSRSIHVRWLVEWIFLKNYKNNRNNGAWLYKQRGI